MKLLVGLGNPGAEYARQRHNIGFMALDRIAENHRLPPWRQKFSAYLTEGEIGGQRTVLLKPLTFMNDSGRAVQDAAQFFKIAIDDIIVLHDELDLVPARVKVKVGGGNAGHNGLRSITAHLGNGYARVRLGIGHPGSKELVHNWVLGNFAKSDQAWLDDVLDAVARAAPQLTSGQLERFQNDVMATSQADKEALPRATPVPGPKLAAKHPAGERGNKQQNAIAENLRKWMDARKKPGE